MLLKRQLRRAAAIVIACLLGTHVSYVAAGIPPGIPDLPMDGTSQLAGWVYIDRNNDGQINFATHANPEFAIEDVRIDLYRQSAPNTIIDTEFTDEFGRFYFTGLMDDIYILRQVQPASYIDGKTTLGGVYPLALPGGAVEVGEEEDENEIRNIDLPADRRGEFYLFGELGFAPGFVSKRFLSGSPPLLDFGNEEPALTIPEPASIGLATMALGIGLFPRRRRRKPREVS